MDKKELSDLIRIPQEYRAMGFDGIFISDIYEDLVYTSYFDQACNLNQPLYGTINKKDLDQLIVGRMLEKRYKKPVFFKESDSKNKYLYSGLSKKVGNYHIGYTRRIKIKDEFFKLFNFDFNKRYQFLINSQFNVFDMDKKEIGPFFQYAHAVQITMDDLSFFVNIVDFIFTFKVSQMFKLDTKKGQSILFIVIYKNSKYLKLYPQTDILSVI